MTRYEYKIIDAQNVVGTALTDLLNDYGGQGWRVVTQIDSADRGNSQFLLERPLIDQADLYYDVQNETQDVADHSSGSKYARLDSANEYED